MQIAQKLREPVISILQAADFQGLPKQFYPVIMLLLEINDFKVMNIKNVADKIITIYEQFKGNFDKYLSQKKFSKLHEELRQYVRKIFTKVDQYVKNLRPTPPRNQFINKGQQQIFTKQRNPLNLFNMFLNVPKLQSTEQIEFFQRRMYQVCKNSMPQVLQNLAISASKRSNIYKPNYSSNFRMGYQKPPQYEMPGSFLPYYQNPNSNYQGQQPYMGTNKPSNPYRMEHSSIGNFRPYNRDDDLDFLNPQHKQVYSYQKILSPQKDNENKRYYSQKSIHFEDYQDRSPVNEGFTLFSPLDKAEKKIPKKFNNLNSQHQDQYEPLPRKILKKDQGDKLVQERKKQQITCTCSTFMEKKCKFCQIRSFDPFNEVQETIKLLVISEQYCQLLVDIDDTIKQKILTDSQNYDIQIRSLKIQGTKQEIQWPQKLKIYLNANQIAEFSYDIKKKFSKKQPQGTFLFSKYTEEISTIDKITLKLQIQGQKQQENRIKTHIIGIFLIKKQSIQKLGQEIKKKMKIYNISDFFNSQSEEIKDPNKIIILPADQLTKQIIDDPVRGIYCKHPQCFDLKSFLQFQKFADVRNWKCPICQKASKQFILDEQLKEIFNDVKKMIKQPIKILVYKSGGYKIIFEQEKKKEPKRFQENLYVENYQCNNQQQQELNEKDNVNNKQRNQPQQ